ncbi:MAG: winged helix DNA-binding protein [Bacteroidia bacterium]|jgi:DNA-binding MarR family transcriptional regulator|nr:winged helix DNA-binding protein [Bacteroidia bacterium]
MSNTQVIADLISQFQVYEQTHRKVSTSDFAVWLLKSEQEINVAKQINMGNDDKSATKKVEELDNGIGILLGLLNKYARHYSKIVLEDLPVNTVDEFGYLAQLSTFTQMTKSELISKTMDGKTTGTDIIRRLIAGGLVKEMNNPDDKRSKLIKITDKGKKVILKSYEKMSMASKSVTGNLTINEKQILIKLLGKLGEYHRLNEPDITENLKTAINH